jgi:succinate dehydrogenase/fumarate reductase flavoprotein subunit
MEEFTQNYGVVENGKYTITRDAGSYAILKEVEAGRGTPHGGVYLSFQHVPETKLREAFGPVIDKLAENGIDLTKMPVEVSPIAHYHMGGIAADAQMQTGLPGLFAAGEAVGGANGANRLSGNAITEAFVFGRRAGQTAAAFANRAVAETAPAENEAAIVDLITADEPAHAINTAELVQTLQATMQDDVGALRNETGLKRALDTIDAMTAQIGDRPQGSGKSFDMRRVDWLDLRNMLLVAKSVTQAALARTETRGAQHREDFSETSPDWAVNQFITLRDGQMMLSKRDALQSALFGAAAS